MQDLLRALTPADYHFVVGVIEGQIPFLHGPGLRAKLAALEQEETQEARGALCERLEHTIRYLGSADIAYYFRKVVGRAPGAPFNEVIRDTAKLLKVTLPRLGTDREMLSTLAQDYATQQFARLSPEEQQALLESLGVERERAQAFLKKSAGVFALPVLIQAFGAIVVQGLIKTVLFGIIAKIIGKQLTARLFTYLFSFVPRWVGWVSPVAWTLSLGWAAVDIQGPATRKTVPIVLYLGLCCVRDTES